ncbi:6-bladed beta-propeller [Niabella ginsengisoli]|uniref:6-bladed beta-propeller n=1 Tax=Niabella ginsengisoli TaxID=522298 RepID=A0ABS9SPY1_9BACT|nr:6-bladed beta-propeller [Niabella ginsengisoli]MCH5600427.1 6-bladed beta-propeller [Niabella ginsengisoli]
MEHQKIIIFIFEINEHFLCGSPRPNGIHPGGHPTKRIVRRGGQTKNIRMKKWMTIFCFIVYHSAFTQGVAKELYFEPGFAAGAGVSKVFAEVNYIPLQTTKKSIFGRIRKLIVSDQYFIIWDADTNFIYFFDKTGKFIKKYRPPNCTIKTIQLDKRRNAIFISGSNKNFDFSPAEIEKMMEDPTNASFARFTWSAYYDLADIQNEKVQRVKDFSLSLVSPTIYVNNWWAYSYIYSNRKFADTKDYELKVYDGKKI